MSWKPSEENFRTEESQKSKAAKGPGKIRTDKCSSGSATWRPPVILTKAVSMEWHEHKFEPVKSGNIYSCYS